MSRGHVQEQKVWGDPAGCSQNTDISLPQVNARVFIIQASPTFAGDKRVHDSFPARVFLWQCCTNAFWPELVTHGYWATLGRVVARTLEWESGFILNGPPGPLFVYRTPSSQSGPWRAFSLVSSCHPSIQLSLALTLSHVPTCTFIPISWTHSA